MAEGGSALVDPLGDPKHWDCFNCVARWSDTHSAGVALFALYLRDDSRRGLPPRLIHYFRIAAWCRSWLMYSVLLKHPPARELNLSEVLAFTLPDSPEGYNAVWLLCERGAKLDKRYKWERSNIGESYQWKTNIVRTCRRVRGAAIVLYGALRKRRGMDRNVAAMIAREVWAQRRLWHATPEDRRGEEEKKKRKK